MLSAMLYIKAAAHSDDLLRQHQQHSDVDAEDSQLSHDGERAVLGRNCPGHLVLADLSVVVMAGFTSQLVSSLEGVEPLEQRDDHAGSLSPRGEGRDETLLREAVPWGSYRRKSLTRRLYSGCRVPVRRLSVTCRL